MEQAVDLTSDLVLRDGIVVENCTREPWKGVLRSSGPSSIVLGSSSPRSPPRTFPTSTRTIRQTASPPFAPWTQLQALL
ncbi:hypothetical protein EXIGLDRAFT_722014 [Exidia glandulosa HHB12029]|uniref:Uncharacterized protein n=1 Tax=Exidia glandulosa HHB12029 TaxID=1314781 RepID=A0A165FIZ8_EXIGL|nr:hypothetical protein EXIGLDRAFT_722014 [Exidia glandulosa HHB12029]